MKKETLIRVIDEEFGDAQPMSWFTDVILRSFKKNDDRITQATDQYIDEADTVRETLTQLHMLIVAKEKNHKDGVRILRDRKKWSKE